jgi:peptidoglycan/LPS O-acetylase OafA/YrhL
MPFVIDSHRASLARAVVAALTFHINWLEAHRGYLPGNWDVLWSLSVEEMFYLFFPLCCRWLRGGRMLVTLLLGFAIAGPFARTVLTHNQLWADYSYLSCMDAIALGCLAALIAHRFHLGPRLSMVVQGLGVIAVVLVTVFKRQVSQLGLYKSGLDMTVLALGVALTLMALAQRRQPGRSWTAPLRWLGRNSYEVYLTHMFVVFGLLQVFVAFGSPYRWAPLWYGIIVCLSGTLGALVARFYSEPLNRRLRAGGGVGAPHPSIS